MNIFINQKLNFTNKNISAPNVEQTELGANLKPLQSSVGNPFQNLPVDIFQKQTPEEAEVELIPEKASVDVPGKRLNDIDSDILNKSLVQYLPTESLRIEIQLEQKEKELSEASKQMQDYELLELDKNSEKFKELNLKQSKLAHDIQKYKIQYRAIGFVYKLSDTCSDISSKVSQRLESLNEQVNHNSFIKGFKKVIPILRQREEVSTTLKKFNALQSNITDYLSGKNPFGELDKNNNEFVGLMTAYNKLGVYAEKIKQPVEESKFKVSAFFNNALDYTSRLWGNIKDFFQLAKEKYEQK